MKYSNCGSECHHVSGQTVACGFISTKQHSDFIISPNYSLIQHSLEK